MVARLSRCPGSRRASTPTVMSTVATASGWRHSRPTSKRHSTAFGVGGGPDAMDRHRARGKLPARERIERLIDPGAAFLELSPLAAHDMYDGQAPGAGIVCGIGAGLRKSLRDRRQRRHRQRRQLLPDDGEEASARAGDRRAEPSPVHLPGRFGRRLPAASGRGVPRPRPLRPDLLQPGADVGGGDPTDRGGDGLVHRRRRVRPGHERRDGDREAAPAPSSWAGRRW